MREIASQSEFLHRKAEERLENPVYTFLAVHPSCSKHEEARRKAAF